MSKHTFWTTAPLVVLLTVASPVTADDWPSYFKTLDQPALRAETMERLTQFAETFAGTAAAKDAREVLKRDKKTENADVWIGETLGFVDRALCDSPSSEKNASIREAVLRILDYPMHVNRSSRPERENYGTAWSQAVGDYFQRVLSRAIEGIAVAKVEEGLAVWKMYNMGFVVKSKNRTVGFDIHPGNVQTASKLSRAQQETLADELDILFISHIHGDHLNDAFIQLMLESGKKVVLPAPIRPELEHRNLVRLYDDYRKETVLSGIQIRCFPGWQSRDTPMNVYAVTLDGHTVSHNGDNCRRDIYSEIPKHSQVDILLANCWSGYPVYRKATQPKLTITGHENELAHTVSHRESFLKTFTQLAEIGNPPTVRILQWGESIVWQP